MAFHVSCPITCRKICFCALGFPRRLQSEKGKNEFMQEVVRIKQFLNDPWLIKSRRDDTIQVKVPKVVVSTVPQPMMNLPAVAIGGDDAAAAASAQLKRVALQKQAAAASLMAEDYARRFEFGDLVTSVDTAGEEQVMSNTKIMCRLCMRGDNEGSDRARKMLSCNSCSKKYHRGCVKYWSRNRDLFHWSSWTCPSCRICEVCHRTGDPNKFMFCKRCDAAYHCYCQQPPHKNVGHGPYLCPQHTKCHSCGSSVAGNGLSLRWFLGYTCCDACGRLFVKNNYCPVCLKVYRDSEATPMVCCDICERWVHCPCDGISEAKYDQFQVNGNLQYVCPTCRGECCQIRSLEEASQELWKRRDETDKDLIASLRAAAGLPTQEEIFDISPFSDDEEAGPVLKNEYGRSLKISLKGVGDKSPKKNGKKSSSKKSGKKKVNEISLMHSTGNYKNEEMQYSGEPGFFSPMTGSLTEGVCSVNEAAVSKQRYVEEITATNETKPSRTIKIKSNKPQSSHISVPKSAQGPKLVIHLGGKTKSTTSTPRSNDNADQVRGSTKLREKNDNLIKFKNVNPEVLNTSSQHSGGELVHSHEYISPKNTGSLLGKRGTEDLKSTRTGSEVPVSKRSRNSLMKSAEDMSTVSSDLIDVKISSVSNSQASEKDRKPNLKFKIPKSSNNGNQSGGPSSNSKIEIQNTLPLAGKHEITYSRGQRSKRKRPAQGNDETSQLGEDNNTMKDFSDASWILQKLGKDAAGKRVEIHQPSDNSWHRGTINDVFEGTSVASIALDDGKAMNFELGKQGIRFASQKQKR